MLACWTVACSHFLHWLCMAKFEFLNIPCEIPSIACLACTSSERAVWAELCPTAEWSLSSAHPLLHEQMPGKWSDSEQISSLCVLRGMGFISEGSDAWGEMAPACTEMAEPRKGQLLNWSRCHPLGFAMCSAISSLWLSTWTRSSRGEQLEEVTSTAVTLSTTTAVALKETRWAMPLVREGPLGQPRLIWLGQAFTLFFTSAFPGLCKLSSSPHPSWKPSATPLPRFK